jgi:hypothetical protein
LIVLSTASAVAYGQIINSSVIGFVTDSSAAAVPGAKVTIKEGQTGFTQTSSTNTLGEYSILAIPAGDYTFTVEKEGFETLVRPGQTITQQLAARVDFVLQVGSMHQTVEVQGAVPLLETETPSNSVTLNNVTVTELPTLGHNFLQTAILSPGVLPLNANSILTIVEGNYFTNGVQYKPVSVDISGGRPEYSAFVEDGFDVRDPIYGGYLYQPTPEAISSYRIVRGYDGAQYGGEPSIVYVSTQGGTNQYHGAVWEYHQDAGLEAHAFNIPTIPPLTYNQPGFTLGGPLIPKLKDKTFVFGEFQTTRDRSSSPTIGIVPTAAEWAGDLSAIPQQIYNPFDIVNGQRQPFQNNQIPTALLSPVGQKYKQFMPLPTIGGAPYGSFNFATTGRTINDDTQYLVRVDQELPRGGRMFAKWFRDKDNSISFGMTSAAGIYNPLRGQTGSIEWDQPLKPNWLNTLRLAIFRSVTDFGGVPTSQYIGQVLGLANTNPDPAYWGLPSIGISGITTPTTLNFNLHRLTTREGIHDNVSYVGGRHTVDFGFIVQPTWFPQHNGADPRGVITYSGPYTAQSPTSTVLGPGLADFLLGAYVDGYANNTGFDPLLSEPYWAWYVQDKIKVSRRLTVTLGLRWDYWEPPVEKYNRWVAFDQNSGQLVFALKDPFTWQTDHTTLSDWPGGRGMFVNWKKTNFSPRIGIAYLLTPNTTVRAGFGTYYSQGLANFQIFSSFGNGAPPFANVVAVSNDTTLLTPASLDSSLFPAPVVGQITQGSSPTSPDLHAPQSYVEQATFSVERQLGANMVASVAYNGSFGHHVMGDFDINQAALFNPNNPLTLAQRRPYPFFSDITMQNNSDNSSYNALAAHFEKRFSTGVSLIASYTWSKALDLFSSNGNGSENQNALCRECDRGLADFDMRNYFTFGYVWRLPFGANHKFVSQGPASKILGGWQWSGITQFQAGTPLNPSMPTSQANVDFSSVTRTNRICDGRLSHPTLSEWFNTSCFPAEPVNTFGNSGRNVIIGPGAQLWDMSIERILRLREHFDITVRGEFYSVFNHQNWGSPDIYEPDPQFGEIFGKSNPRVVQFAMKLKS